MDYKKFSVKDFVLDKSFQNWVKYPDDVSNSKKWESFLSSHPEKEKEIEEASYILRNIPVNKYELSNEELEKLWKKINGGKTKEFTGDNQKSYEIDATKENKDNILAYNFYKKYWYKIAAVLVFGIFSVYIFFLFNNDKQEQVFITGNGEVETIMLPDSSEVILNANSKITYQKPLQFQKGDKNAKGGELARQVKLEGEAFFDIKEKEIGNRKINFIVHTSNADIEVLGTRFNVNNRRNITKVVLASGKVKVHLPKNLLTGLKPNSSLLMEPGELVEINENNHKINRKVVDPEQYISWKQDKLIFENKPLSEIATILEDTYGYEVIIQDSLLAHRKFTGSTPRKDVNILFKKLAQLFDIKISQNENKIIINKK